MRYASRRMMIDVPSVREVTFRAYAKSSVILYQ